MALEVAVIGAGIVGASCAFHLSRRGAKVRVLERAPSPATGATGKSAAGIRHQFSDPVNVRMSVCSAAEFRRFEALTGVSAGYRKVGYLFLLPPELWAAWGEQRAMQRALGARVEALEVAALRARFPYLNATGLAGASFGPDDGVVDPHAVTLGYLGAARRAGATLHLGAEVWGLEHKRGHWHVHTSTGTLTADVVVNAAGAHAREIGALAGLDLPVLPYRRNVYATAPLPDFPHPTPLMIDLTTNVWLRSEGARFIMGLSNPDEPPGDNQAVDWGWLEHLLDLALPRFPFLEGAGLERRACWAGLYAVTPDHMPILGRAESLPSFVNACGFSGHGVQHSPATGRIVAEEVCDGQTHSFDLTRLRLGRFRAANSPTERNIV